MTTLDIESVSAFVLTADLGSFTKAARALGTSQAAISVKIKRLEDRLGYRLLERTPRKVQLTSHGATFLHPARHFVSAHEMAVRGLSVATQRLTLGISDQVAGPGLPALLANLNVHAPNLVVEVHIEASRNLMDAFERGAMDAVIVRREDNRRGGERLLKERMGWFAAAHWSHDPTQPLRLAALAPSCGIRNVATQTLDAAKIAWTEVFLGGGLGAISAAVSAGLAVAPMPYSVAPVGALDVGSSLGLPTLPDSEVVLHSGLSDQTSRRALNTLAAWWRGGTSPR
ncbi:MULTISPECIES: LysR family transcriptional regulator [Pandoraea]|uniref:LysR family transcriptional regulator n=1 Tax=Pandoraea TaxID=93217 RepID=UPI001F5C6D40|nr:MULTISPECIES: LysR family transcriptional regulator [Pandoraea]MCI3206499.1 LysR family transcriptional regulator [Pandoraea sp. LA3]MDN4584527.1 LysR family transcriptional regulator [Pandoraea capi]